MFKKIITMLMTPTSEEIEKIKVLEKEGRFNEHVDPFGAEYEKVDENFEYIPKGIFKRIKNFFLTIFIVNPFKRQCIRVTHTTVVGKENLKGIKSAIICSNHVNKVDAISIMHALKPRKTYATGAEFNNMKGFFGSMMKLGGMLPMSTSIKGQQNFSNTIKKLLDKNKYILFFPEASEWNGYEKPRPHIRGAYFYATKFDKPIIPCFITFKDIKDSSVRQYIVNILKPIYPNKDLSNKENEAYMMDSCLNEYKECYQKFYNQQL
jgi:1-acyl-sn-glycerol-3-phosphate acyltransferase